MYMLYNNCAVGLFLNKVPSSAECPDEIDDPSIWGKEKGRGVGGLFCFLKASCRTEESRGKDVLGNDINSLCTD